MKWRISWGFRNHASLQWSVEQESLSTFPWLTVTPDQWLIATRIEVTP